MAVITFSTTFDLTGVTKKFIFEDTSNYSGQGISLADVNGVFKIISPSSITIYDNTDYSNSGCDIRNSVSRLNQLVIPVPLDVNGDPELGNYHVEYSVYDSNLDEYSLVDNDYDFQYTSPEASITLTSDCVLPVFTSTDNTDYVVDGVEPAISRVHILEYPDGAETEDITSVLAEIQTSVFYNGLQTSTLTSTLTYAFPDGPFTVLDIVIGTESLIVDCSLTCSIACCIQTLENTMNEYKTTNSLKYEEYRNKFTLVMSYIGLIKLSLECELDTDISDYLNKIQQIANCTTNCCDGSEVPSRVVGLGFQLTNVLVDTCNNGIEVSVSINGDNTTYTVCLSDGVVDLLDSIDHTVVAVGSGLIMSSNTIGTTTTYTLSSVVSGQISSTNTPQIFDGVDPYNLQSTVSATAATSGTYLAIYEADINTLSSAYLEFNYYFMLTGVFTPIGTNGNRHTLIKAQGIYKIMLSQILTLTATNVVATGYGVITHQTDHEISNQSITLIRIS